MEPPQLDDSNFVQQLEAQLVTSGSSTCLSSAGGKVYDFFVVSGGLSHGVRSVTANPSTAFSPHTAVRLEFFEQLAQLQVLSFQKPPPIPMSAMVGPPAEPPDYSQYDSLVEKCRRALEARQADMVDIYLHKLYKICGNLAERGIM